MDQVGSLILVSSVLLDMCNNTYILKDEMGSNFDLQAATPDWQQTDVRSLEAFLGFREGIEIIVELRGQDAAAVIELLDQVPLSSLLLSHTDSHTCRHWIYPPSRNVKKRDTRSCSVSSVTHVISSLHHIAYRMVWRFWERTHICRVGFRMCGLDATETSWWLSNR